MNGLPPTYGGGGGIILYKFQGETWIELGKIMSWVYLLPPTTHWLFGRLDE